MLGEDGRWPTSILENYGKLILKDPPGLCAMPISNKQSCASASPSGDGTLKIDLFVGAPPCRIVHADCTTSRGGLQMIQFDFESAVSR